MSFFNRNKNQNSSMYFISDFEDDEFVKKDDIDLKIRIGLIVSNIVACKNRFLEITGAYGTIWT